MGRFRRLRNSKAIRNLVRETVVSADDLIYPYFVVERPQAAGAVESMPGIERFTIDQLLKEIELYIQVGGQAALIFGLPERKDERGGAAWHEKGIVQQAVRAVKKEFPEFLVITDVCLCGYRGSVGHDGLPGGPDPAGLG